MDSIDRGASASTRRPSRPAISGLDDPGDWFEAAWECLQEPRPEQHYQVAAMLATVLEGEDGEGGDLAVPGEAVVANVGVGEALSKLRAGLKIAN